MNMKKAAEAVREAYMSHAYYWEQCDLEEIAVDDEGNFTIYRNPYGDVKQVGDDWVVHFVDPEDDDNGLFPREPIRLKVWKTMTPSGLYGSEIIAETSERAIEIAAAPPIREKVLDVQDDILVVPDE